MISQEEQRLMDELWSYLDISRHEEQPKDWNTLLILADLHEDRDEPNDRFFSVALRWMHQHHKRPLGEFWYNEARTTIKIADRVDVFSDLPESIWKAIQAEENKQIQNKRFENSKDAVMALGTALLTLEEKRKT